MKYEAVFGDQSLFDGCHDETAYIVIATSNGRKFVAGEFTEYGIVEGDVKSDGLRIAMRRIIADPKRWTLEDKKAGMLPEVGCIVIGCDKKEYEVLAQERCELALRDTSNRNLMLITVSAFNRDFKPIETPEEKAARLREEWCIKALSSCSILSGMQKYELKRLGGYIEDIYDALLSGDIPVPGKE